MERHGIGPIDVVVVNLYPFEATITKPGCTFDEAIEHIDIGGPSMLRSAAKKHAGVMVVVGPAGYGPVLGGLRAGGGSPAKGRGLGRWGFTPTHRYDCNF